MQPPIERSGRTMAKDSTNSNRLIPQSPSYRVGPSKPSHVLEAEKIRRKIDKRRSRTPETLKKTKNTFTSRFRQLPSQSIKGGADSNNKLNRFGFRRRSKSQNNLNHVGMNFGLEKVAEEENHDEDFMSESLVSQEKFNTELKNKSSNNNNFASVNFASSFI